MASPEQKTPQEELLKELQVLMLLRVLFISLLLGALIFIQIRATRTYFGDIHTSHYLLLAGVYFLSIIYVFLLKQSKNITLQAYLQLFVDTLVITVLIYTTGGIESIFSFLYILNIFNGSILLYRKGGMMIASASSILYGILLDLHYYGVVHPLGSRFDYPETYQSAYLFFTILANITGFYLVGYLSSFLSEQAKKSLAELKVKEVDLNRLEVLNENIIGSITSGLIVLDDQERIILFNPAAERIFGVKGNQVHRHRIGDNLPLLAKHIPKKSFMSNELPETQTPITDFTYENPNGDKINLQLSISPLHYSSGEQKGQILILQDMTEMKQIQEEMKKVEGLALIGELAAGMAHEIRNPMASISGSIEVLRDEIDQNDVNIRLMDIISRETDRLNDLVADFLLFARPQRMKLAEIDLNQLILESLELFKNSRDSSTAIKIFTDFHHPLIIESDSDQLKQVLLNLFINASEAMGKSGELHITTSLELASPKTGFDEAKIIIRDTGDGFDEKGLSHLFLPFFTTKERGSGLGLAIVKRIVDRLEGKIFGANHPEGGAEIIILFPVRSLLSSPDVK